MTQSSSVSIPWQELSEALDGDFSTENTILLQHSEDASIFQVKPLAVAFPKNKNDIKTALTFCRNHKIPVFPWGAGTSRGGQALGKGLILNFQKHMNKILDFDKRKGLLTVEPGAYYSDVQKYLQQQGRSFPPDPSYHQCTIGGMVANNAAGIRSVKYGATIQHVESMQYLTVDGEEHRSDKESSIQKRIHNLLQDSWTEIQKDFPKVEKNSAGYNLNLCYENGPTGELPNLTKLLVGSEGTLGIITEVKLHTVPLQAHSTLLIAYFKTLAAALEASLVLRNYNIAACELVDKVLLDLHGESSMKALSYGSQNGPKHAKKIEKNSYLDRFYELESEAVLLIEFEADTKESCSALAWEASKALIEGRHLAQYINEVTEPEEVKLAWDLRRHSSPILNKLEDGKISIKPLWAVEDVSLPRENFLAYVEEQQKIFIKNKLVCSFFGHAASANLHIDPVSIDPRVALQDKEVAALYKKVAEESYDLVIHFGGSISGEHGDGLLRTPYLRKQYPVSYLIFQEVKNIFDPLNLLNPGKIVEYSL